QMASRRCRLPGRRQIRKEMIDAAGCVLPAGYAGAGLAVPGFVAPAPLPRLSALSRLGSDSRAALAQRAGLVRGSLQRDSAGVLDAAADFHRRAGRWAVYAAARRQDRPGARRGGAVRLRKDFAAGDCGDLPLHPPPDVLLPAEIGRASCRERVYARLVWPAIQK